VRLALEPTPPFDARPTLAALGGFAASPAARVLEDDAFLQAWRPPARDGHDSLDPVVARVRFRGTIDRPRVDVAAAEPLGDEGRASLLEHLRAALALDVDTAALGRVDDPTFAPVYRALRGYHPPRFPTPFEAACWAVIRQRTPLAFAEASMARVVQLLGERREGFGRSFTLFPEPAAIDDDARPALLAATRNTRKVDRLVPLARAFAAVPAGWWQGASYPEAFRRLTAMPGLGPWSAELVLLRGLGRYERMPWTDTGALPALSQLYTPGLSLARGSARELAERYGWLQGLWLLYVKRYVFTLGRP